MKGVSDIIAVLLMLIITIGLAALTYSYIMGIWGSRTAVKLSLASTQHICNSTHFRFDVRNDGSSKSGEVTITVTDSNGNNALDGSCSIANIPALSTNSTACKRASGESVGGYTVTLSTKGGVPFTTTFYCGVAS